jgi:membrane protein required for colicin V production
VSIFTPLFSSVVQRSALNGLDQAAGFLFGVFRGILLVAVAFFVYQTVLSSQNVAMVDNSRSAIVFSRMADKIAERDPEATLSWVTSQYQQLVGECGAPE